MKKWQFKGYILEEILAHLMRISGYRLIDSAPPYDERDLIPPDLCMRWNGLNLRWRWAYHQVDVLWEFNWTPAFIFPLRLITEAKFYSHDKVDIDVVRSQIGILADINQNHFSISNHFKTRHNYSSVIFSASGFTKDAIDMAYAHQIPLIDLNNPIYNWIKYWINNFSDFIFRGRAQISAKEANILRTALRIFLKNIYSNNAEPNSFLTHIMERLAWNDYDYDLKNASNAITSIIQDRRKLFLGSSKWWLGLILYTETPEEFIMFSKRFPSHDIIINWKNDGKIWTIEPMRKLDNSIFYILKFNLPDRLYELIFKTSDNIQEAALNLKEQMFSVISIYYYDHEENSDYVFNLRFDLSNFKRRSLD